MKRKKYKRKNKKTILIIISILVLFITVPCVYAFYFAKYESSIISKFILKDDLVNSYVRATFLTYWVDIKRCDDEEDLTTCDISGKSSWTINDSVINPDWYLLEDGYYYYKSGIDGNEINSDTIKNSGVALIDSNLSLSELTTEHLATAGIIPQYEIIYEFIEDGSTEDSWKVSYASGSPVVVE